MAFKTINISQMLVETLRAPFVVNKSGQLSENYKFSLCCLYSLQAILDAYNIWCRRENLIANCKWVYGQLTNVLNLLYPNVSNPSRPIYLTNATSASYVFAPGVSEGGSTTFAPGIVEGGSTTFASGIQDSIITNTTAVINVPSEIIGVVYQNVTITLAEITATTEQIRLAGVATPIIQTY
jgi:hypothetical protein